MKILVIRRDNIGDLVCTTPLFSALRSAYPGAWLGVLANAYNAPVLAGNPDVDAVFAYRKAKHRKSPETRWSVWGETLSLLFRLRRMKLDLVLCASPGARRYARLLGARRVIEHERDIPGHEVEVTFALARKLGIETPPGPVSVYPDNSLVEALRERHGLTLAPGRTLAIHISARKVSQRWPLESFAELIRKVLTQRQAERVLLFWAPGSADDARHPGDDEKAAFLVASLAGLPVIPIATASLGELVAGLSLADCVILSDGGAMHIAAGLGKPIVCFFGNSSAERWHPWGVPYELLQKESRDVNDIGVEETLAALERLLSRL